MATPSYLQSELSAIINGRLHGKFAQVQSTTVTMNRAVRAVLGDMDMRSMKRTSPLSPNMFDEVYQYATPSDLKGDKIIDIRKQVNRDSVEHWLLMTETDFDRYKGIKPYRIALRDDSFSRLLLIDGVEGEESTVIHNCDSLTANGTWAVVAGTDSSNLTLDTGNVVEGAGALNFDMAKGAATGAIELTGATQVDLTDYDEIGSIFLWVFIPDYSDAQGDTVTNFILRWGNDTSNYWSVTVTTNHEGNTFHDGWNLLRFDWNGASETGTVAPAAIDYLRLTVTKSTSLEADTDWRVDDIVCRLGDVYDVVYYSKYGWQTTAGVYIEESTTSTDLVIADTDEIEGIALKGAELAAQELKEYTELPYFRDEYLKWKMNYMKNNPSEALKVINKYAALPRFQK